MKKFLFLVVVLFLGSCGSDELKGCSVRLPSGTVIEIDIADSPETRSKGLMFVKELGKNKGMFFVFGEDGFHSFWMKNTFIPLDIIWINADMKVVHIEKNIQPCQNDPCPSYSTIRRSRYALEVNSGTADEESLSIGDCIRLIGRDCPY